MSGVRRRLSNRNALVIKPQQNCLAGFPRRSFYFICNVLIAVGAAAGSYGPGTSHKGCRTRYTKAREQAAFDWRL
jgi:hypothetical protein